MRRMSFLGALLLAVATAGCAKSATTTGALGVDPETVVPSRRAGPMYKPSSRSKLPMDISTDAYGRSALAPEAPALGVVAPDFELPAHSGDAIRFSELWQRGRTVLVFYRGDW